VRDSDLDRRNARRVARVIVLVAAACVAFVLNYWGFRRLHGLNQHHSASDSVYQALRAFRLDADVPPGRANWQLEIGRYLAPLVVAYAALAATFALARHRVEAWLVRRAARDHVVVIGNGEHAIAVVQALRTQDREVVVVDDDRDQARRTGLRAAGAKVVTGDTTQPAAARAARVSHARDVVILVGSDSDNLRALAAATAALPATLTRAPIFHVGIADFSTWQELGRHALAVGTDDRNEFFNLTDRSARRLVDEAVRISNDQALDQCVLDGAGPLAVRTASHLIRTAIHSGRRPTLVLGRSSADRLLVDIEAAEPWCRDAADLVVFDGDPTDAPRMAIVCGDHDDAVLLARGISLMHTLPGTQVVVGLSSTHAVAPSQIFGVPVSRLTVVNAQAAALARDLRENATFEILARAKHEDYVRRERERGVTPAENPSLVPWDELPDSLKESNRRFAEAVGPLVGQLGATIRPLTKAPVLDDLDVPEPLLEQLAADEHERWVEERTRAGWRVTQGSKDPEAGLHPLLVPWDELPEAEKQKDRDIFHALPRMLSLVGYELVLPADDAEVRERPRLPAGSG
jgi:voltage-gated potassium channel Kch